MRICVHSVYSYSDRFPDRAVGFARTVRGLAELDRVGRHELVDAPADAEAVLIPELQSHFDTWSFAHLRRALRTWPHLHKTYVYCDVDRPPYVLPGLYPSARSWAVDRRRQCGFPYLGVPPEDVEPLFEQTEPDLLFSFSGQIQNHRCRRDILRIQTHPRAEVFDTSGKYLFNCPPEERAFLRERYRQQLARTKFVLCPRGGGTSSYRLFEALAAGRVPVIISDAWVAPPGPDWPRFALQVRERDVRRIPALLEAEEPSFEQRAQLARQAFADHFSRGALFNYLGDCLERLHRRRGPALRGSAGRCLATLHAAAWHARNRSRRLASGTLKQIRKGCRGWARPSEAPAVAGRHDR